MRVAHYLSTVSKSEIMKSSGDQSDLSQVFEVDDIFTRKDAISGLKSSLWADLSKLVNTPLDSSNFGI